MSKSSQQVAGPLAEHSTTLDHVLLACPDLDAAASRLRRQTGLGAVAGGYHPGGTANLLVPLWSGQYVELIAPDWERESAWDSDTKELADALSRRGAHFAGWGLRATDLPGLARAIGGVLGEGHITDAEGSPGSSWTYLVHHPEQPGWPFLIEYHADPDARLQSWRRRHAEAEPTEKALAYASMTVSVQFPESLAAWLGDLSALGVTVVSVVAPGVRDVAVETATGVRTLSCGP